MRSRDPGLVRVPQISGSLNFFSVTHAALTFVIRPHQWPELDPMVPYIFSP